MTIIFLNFQTKENLISLLIKNGNTIEFMESFDDDTEYPVHSIKVIYVHETV